ncbi:hypothetical protein [Bdellovibrio sp. HCB337]|uniref:hypothetical protein n=1 Tax=Bdellovibrio sp. HCB337 TaxID=3394358 RepID=UPI0039A69175
MKFFAAFFSFFCFSFLNCASAKAEPYGHRTGQRFEITAQSLCKQSCHNFEFGKKSSWPCTAAEEIQFAALEANYSKPFKSFHAMSAKDFYAPTGLSPPLLFA